MTYEMVAKKKHLKYQARKAPSTSVEGSATLVKDSRVEVSKPIRLKKSKLLAVRSNEPLMTTELTAAESKVVRRELIHLLVSASVIVVLYIGLWLLLERAGIEARLTDIIKL